MSGADYITMTDQQIDDALAAAICAVCGCAKARSLPFCPTDFAALSLPARLALQNPQQRRDAFRSALRHLDLNRDRRREFNAWPYATDDDLYAAHYRWREHKRCEAPGCGRRISIWLTPKGTVMALDRFTRQPHRQDCADPDYFRRRAEARQAQQDAARAAKKLQTSARRRRRA